MSDGLLSTETVMPPMGGVALLACKLAYERAYGPGTWQCWTPDVRPERWSAPESWPAPGPTPANREYYAIIDRIARGEAP